jgi:translation initiation factor IF-2
MSSTEQSGAPAEGSATSPAPAAAFPSFGTTRGSGLARGKRPSSAAATAASAAPTDYKPTAIEVINAPREYTNPFAPANPEPAEPAPAPAPAAAADVAPVVEPAAPAATPAPAPVAPAPVAEESAQLNILPPAQQRTAPAQTWESDGFSPTRQEAPAEEVDIASIPPQFLYVRPGVKFVPTPKNWGGAPRERRPHAEHAAKAPGADAPAARVDTPAPAKSGGFLGWLKGLFGGSSAGETVAAGSESGDERHDGGRRRHRGGRGRGAEGGGQRRHRGGRGRSRSRGESEGSRQGGSI